MQEMKGALTQILQMATRIEATLPHLATKAELAEMSARLRPSPHMHTSGRCLQP